MRAVAALAIVAVAFGLGEIRQTHHYRNQVQAYHACVNASAYTRSMIEGQCLADYAGAGK